MKAVVHTRYGPPEVLRLAEVPRPAPGPGELLVRVRATTVNRTDCGFRRPTPFLVRAFSGPLRPRHTILGTEFAGEVAAVGPGVTGFAEGERVFGVNADRFGAHAEFLCMPAGAPVTRMPAGASFEEAAAVCDGAILALTYLRAARVGPGRSILVYGASGSIGTAAVQLARHLGARVSAACGPDGLDLVRSLGAHRVIDRTREDFTRSPWTYDVVFDAVGKLAFRRCRGSVAPGGVFAATDLGFGGQNPLLAVLTRRSRRVRVMFPLPRYRREEVEYLRELMEAGRYRAVIDRRYPLERVVEATRYVEAGRKLGNVVLLVDGTGG